MNLSRFEIARLAALMLIAMSALAACVPAPSVFWLRRLAALGGEEQAIAGWQIKRDRTCRGIFEIVEEQT
jgi:hypothetical protein